jgi:ASTRA-associated protein 1
MKNRHGRDNTIKVWQIKDSDIENLSSVLPAEESTDTRRQPWLLHSLLVNALNFCAFAMTSTTTKDKTETQHYDDDSEAILLAVPGTRDTEINVFQLPSEKRLHIIPSLPIHTGKQTFICSK